MKKPFIVLILLIAFNLAAPDSNLMVLRQRHLIEYAQGNHTKKLTESEIIKTKAVIYLKLIIMMSEMERMEKNQAQFNTS